MKSQEKKQNNSKFVNGMGQFLKGCAILFSNSPCYGHLYEPKVPESLRK